MWFDGSGEASIYSEREGRKGGHGVDDQDGSVSCEGARRLWRPTLLILAVLWSKVAC